MIWLPRVFGNDFLLTSGIAECFNSWMDHSNTFSILAIVVLSPVIVANGFSDDVNPLQDALLDPLGFVSPSSHHRNDTLPLIFEAQRSNGLNISSKSEMPSRGTDETSFERAVADWEEFRPAKFPLQEGSFLYGDPKMLLANVQKESTKDLQSLGGPVLPAVICAFGIIGTLWIFVRIRDRSSSRKSFSP